jgi:hypothetical protein
MVRLFYWLLAVLNPFNRRRAKRLNLELLYNWPQQGGSLLWPVEYLFGDGHMAKIGDTFTARIAPTNAAGQSAPVFNVAWTELGDSYDITPAPDGLSATLIARAAGTLNQVEVSALTNGANTLTESVDLPDVEADVDLEALALNLTVA